ncbi:MAG: GGDEF domain-containing protein [Tissierellia bacterium]|nr:GGDEF domain-containing protein [Tissierellia bacterium]
MALATDLNLLMEKELELVSTAAAAIIFVFGSFLSIPFGLYWEKGELVTFGFALHAFLSGPIILKVVHSKIKFDYKVTLVALIIVSVQLTLLFTYGRNIRYIYWIIPGMSLIICAISNSRLLRYLLIADFSIYVIYIIDVFKTYGGMDAGVALFFFNLFIVAAVILVQYLYRYISSEKMKDYAELKAKKEELTVLYEKILIDEGELKAKNEELIKYTNELMEINKKVEFLSYNDLLTGLPNRNMMINQLDYAIESILGTDKSFAFFHIDMINFKKVIDSLGRSNGDLLLVEVAKRIGGVIDNKDMLGRFGGDEFAIILRRGLSNDEILNTSQRIITCFDK